MNETTRPTPPMPRSQQSVRAATMLCFLLLLPMIAAAQEFGNEEADSTYAPSFYIGAFGGVSLISYDVNLFPTTIDSRAVAPQTFPFNSGDGSGIHGGLLFEVVLSPSFNLGLRGAYQAHTGTLTNQYINSTDVRGRDGSAQIATVEGAVATDMSHLILTPYARISPFAFPLYFVLGPSIMLPMGTSYVYTEQVLTPSDVVFRATGRNTRSIGGRDFRNPSTAVAITANLGYEVALTPTLGVFAELGIQPMVNDYISGMKTGETWRSIGIHPTVGIRLGLGGGPEPPPPPRRPDTVAMRDTTRQIRTDSNFVAKGVTPSGLTDTLRIEKKRVQATELHPLLPYVFFDRDSAVIPSRYILFDGKTRRSFEVERLPRGNTLAIYYNILNIIGFRLRENRGVKVKLSGYISQYETDSTLPRRRAEAVKQYLVDVWRIPDRRITVDTTYIGVPRNPSLSDVEARVAASENQRVEIFSENYVLEAPISLPDSTLLAPAGVVRFLPPATTPDSLATGVWSLDVKIGDSLVKGAVTGVGAPPREIDYPIRPDIDPRAGVISSTLIIEDSSYNEMSRVSSRPVYLDHSGSFEQERRVEDGKFVDTYTLMLYSFDSSEIAGFAWRAREIIVAGIKPASEVTIIGHTDRIGIPAYNKELSRKRAEFAQSVLNIQAKSIVAKGEKDLLFEQDSPEGRYYSRTVTIIVETPATAEEIALQTELQRQRQESEARARAQREADEQGKAEEKEKESKEKESRRPQPKKKPTVPLPTIRPSQP